MARVSKQLEGAGHLEDIARRSASSEHVFGRDAWGTLNMQHAEHAASLRAAVTAPRRVPPEPVEL